MDAWLMWLIGVVVVLAPVVLMLVFNGRDTSDSRGRRHDTTWRSKTHS